MAAVNVNNFERAIDSYVWHGIETIAPKYPHATRLLAFPIALATFIRDTLAMPAKCVEALILAAKSIKATEQKKIQKRLMREVWIFTGVYGMSVRMA